LLSGLARDRERSGGGESDEAIAKQRGRKQRGNGRWNLIRLGGVCCQFHWGGAIGARVKDVIWLNNFGTYGIVLDLY
jgi:hypothetical protein